MELHVWIEKTSRLLKMIRPQHILGIVIGYLLFTYLLVYLVDVTAVLRLDNFLITMYEITEMRTQEPTEPLLFAHIFKEGGPTEIFQWLLLAISAILSAYLAGKQSEKNIIYQNDNNQNNIDYTMVNKSKAFCILLSLGLILMLLEDAGNLRHTLTTYLPTTFQQLGIEHTLTGSTAIELIYFALLGLIMLAALVVFYQHAWQFRTPRYLLLLGFVCYGIATMASGTRNIGDWYIQVGTRVNEMIGSGVIADNLSPEHVTGYFSPAERVGFLLMDNLFEESVELLGVGAILAAVIAYGSILLKTDSKNRLN